MTEFAKDVAPVNLEDEMRQSYLAYSMSVIVGRALPDVRDGLKPVHRRILFAMHELKLEWSKSYKKSARVVGDVIGKYHPHGDTAVYDALVRMAQPFSLRYTLIEGQGNFGSIDGDSPAAMRYTESKMSKISAALLQDLEKETVDFIPNYDESEYEPAVLPTRVPNLLINGSSGIAVGMATNIPPHNIGETINACLALLENPQLTILELMEHIPAPDLPTQGIINGTKGIVEAYHTGRGRMIMRARADIEVDAKTDRETIIIYELPYQVNKAKLVAKIAELHKNKAIEGISPDGLRDESNRNGIRIVIELKRGEHAEVLLNQLYKQTDLQCSFGINMVAIEEGQPKLFNLKQILEAFLRHRREIVTRRTIFELKKARARSHTLEGLAVALANIDELIILIRESANSAEAKEKMLAKAWPPGSVATMLERATEIQTHPDGMIGFGMLDGNYHLSDIQAQAILEMRLHRLTGLEQDKIHSEYREILAMIEGLIEILVNPDRLKEVIREELDAVLVQFKDKRLTEIRESTDDINYEDMIVKEDVVVTLSHRGYAKYQKLSDYQAQKRGGRGKSAAKVKDEDYVEHLIIASTHAQLMCFASSGKVYWIKVYNLPEAGRAAAGRPIINLLNLDEGEKITSILPVEEYREDQYIFMATKQGVVKKTSLDKFKNQRSNGLIAITLDDGDALIATAITTGTNDIMLFASGGKANRFSEEDIRGTGRGSRGVRGMNLAQNECVISLIIPIVDGVIITATENGYGKRTRIEEFTAHKRGGKGMIGIQTSERNGAVIGATLIAEDQELMLISSNGILVRTRVAEVSILGRNTQGVRLIRLDESDKLVGLTALEASEEIVIDETLIINSEANIDNVGTDIDTDASTNDETDIIDPKDNGSDE